jgi:hypothetical protein
MKVNEFIQFSKVKLDKLIGIKNFQGWKMSLGFSSLSKK